ncbi:hypothetical protein [Cetobacterium ceti]
MAKLEIVVSPEERALLRVKLLDKYKKLILAQGNYLREYTFDNESYGKAVDKRDNGESLPLEFADYIGGTWSAFLESVSKEIDVSNNGFLKSNKYKCMKIALEEFNDSSNNR